MVPQVLLDMEFLPLCMVITGTYLRVHLQVLATWQLNKELSLHLF
jgi:hypothetical protein